MTIAAPYPADTRAKGWRFELDMERARQSDTWTLASPEARPWLLMMWATAWEQTPCGSLPADDELIAARLGMPMKLFAKHRAILLRKWWLAEDGRYYHDVLVQRVTEMMERRRKESDRKALARAKRDAELQQTPTAVPPLSRGTDEGLPRDSTPGATPEPEPEPEERQTPIPLTGDAPPTPKSTKAARIECPEGVAAQVWSDWLALRRAKKAPVTATVVEGAHSEAAKAGMTLDAFLRVWCARGSQGLQAEWLRPEERQAARPPPVRPLSPGEARMLEACPSAVSESVRQRAAATAPKPLEYVDVVDSPPTARRLG